MDAIGTGEDDPVIGLQLIDRLVESVPPKRRDDFDGGKDDDLGPQSVEMVCKFGRLLTGPGDEDLLLL